jgi:8-oxo-dGTP pyrophosphatase MutT (NUDIX family)
LERQQFAQKAFIWDGDRLFVVRKSDDDPHNPGRWEVPGGRMKFGEDVDEHLSREVSEETGLEVKPGAPFFIWQWTMTDIIPGSDDELQVIAVARKCAPRDPEQVCPTDAHREPTDFLTEMRWVTLDELKHLEVIPSLRPALTTFVEDCAASHEEADARERVVPTG